MAISARHPAAPEVEVRIPPLDLEGALVPGALDEVIALAGRWFTKHLTVEERR